ncbi:MAG: elongation factor Ts, partial [Thermomicrobiaceae bacterium]|nr:elongation factor Ts [Thermomicrobiaceae bacterium]
RAEKKAGRVASQGLVDSYIHGAGRIGALVEVNCETDFVARTQEFRDLVHDIAMQVAATDPQFIAAEDIPEELLALGEQDLGSREQYVKQVALLAQPFIKDPKRSVEDLIKDAIARLGENIVIRRFARFELGAASDVAEE